MSETKYEVLRGLTFPDPKDPSLEKRLEPGVIVEKDELLVNDIPELLRIEAIRKVKGVKSK